MESSSKSATREGNKFLDELYDVTVRNGGTPMQFRLFDVQLCGSLDSVWLRENIVGNEITQAEADWLIAEDLLRVRTNPRGEKGYILYTPYQAEVLKKLIETRRHDVDELRHIMSEWDDYLEAIVMEEPGYDDDQMPDYQHFIRRAHEMLNLFEEREGADDSTIMLKPSETHRAEFVAKAKMWRRICDVVDEKAEDALPAQLRDSLHRQLFHLRWWDEFVRLNMAKQFETAIIQGYGTDVTFDGFSSQGAEVTLGTIDWNSTIRRYQQTRREGKHFP
jgi:hypothetical protein